MKLLLDTHTFIWWDSEPARLSPQALALCQERFVAQRGQCLGNANQTTVGQTQAGSAPERDHRNPATDQQHRDIACYAGTRAGIGKFASLSQGPF